MRLRKWEVQVMMLSGWELPQQRQFYLTRRRAERSANRMTAYTEKIAPDLPWMRWRAVPRGR